MVYISINDNTKEGKKLIAYLESLKIATIHKEPNAKTQKSMMDAKREKRKEIKNTGSWLDKLLN
jgi:hypothetical protein